MIVIDIAKRTLLQTYEDGELKGVTIEIPDVPDAVIDTGTIHPDDIEGYRGFYEDMFSGVPTGEYRVRMAGEKDNWDQYIMCYETEFDENGNPIRAICSFS